jgi:hypothetical protein
MMAPSEIGFAAYVVIDCPRRLIRRAGAATPGGAIATAD